MSERIPDGFVKYFESEVFTEESVPERLKTLHDTKPGVWARIVVLEGRLDYVVSGCARAESPVGTRRYRRHQAH